MGTAYQQRDLQAAIAEETTAGTTPAVAFQRLNIRSVQMDPDFTTEMPSTLTGDRRSYPGVQLDQQQPISVEADLQIGNLTLVQEMALGNDWTAQGSDISATGAISSGVLADSGNGYGGLSVGDFIRVTSTNNAGVICGPITAAAAGSITVPSATIADNGGSESYTVTPLAMLADSTLCKTAVFQRRRVGASTNPFRYSNACYLSTYGLSWEYANFATENFALVARPYATASSSQSTGAETAAPASNFISSLASRFGTIREIGGTETALTISSVQVSLNSSPGRINKVGFDGAFAYTLGKLGIELSFTCVADDDAETFVASARAEATKGLWWTFTDGTDTYGVVLPAMRATSISSTESEGQATTYSITMGAHDPAKDSGATLYNSGSGAYQAALFSYTAP